MIRDHLSCSTTWGGLWRANYGVGDSAMTKCVCDTPTGAVLLRGKTHTRIQRGGIDTEDGSARH